MGTACAVLLLLFLAAVCTEAKKFYQQESPPKQKAGCLCEGSSCYVSPDNLWCLKKQIRSNYIIVLNSEKFNVDSEIGFLVIENVSNLTISGGESGSLIECSPQSTFGLHLKNSTNVTVTGIRFKNCGSIPNRLKYLNVTIDFYNKTTLLMEASTNVTLSNIDIEKSPGLALAVIDFSNDNSRGHLDEANPNFRLIDSTIVDSRKTAMLIYGISSFYIERTVVANSSAGIITVNTGMILKNVDIINCKSSSLINGQLIVRKRLMLYQSSLSNEGQSIYISDSNIQFIGGNSQRGLFVNESNLSITENSTIVFTKFYLTSGTSFALALVSSNVLVSDSILNTTGNVINGGTSILHFANSKIDMINKTSVFFDNNIIESVQNAGLWLFGSSWDMGPDSNLSVTGNIAKKGFFIELIPRTVYVSRNVSLSGSVKIENNTVEEFGVLNIFSSNVLFRGSLTAARNRAVGGVINADTSDLYFTGTATFTDNYASNGGAVTLSVSSMKVFSGASIDFTRNQAEGLGGAIFISNPYYKEVICEPIKVRVAKCSIEVLPKHDSLTNCQLPVSLNQNKAGIAGNAIFGGRMSACWHCIISRKNFDCSKITASDVTDLFIYNGVNDSSDLSSFTSDPTRVCFCENGIPDCYKAVNNITVHPGERFNLSMAIVGYGLGTVPGSVIARGSYGSKGSVSNQSLFDSNLEYSQEIRGTMCEDIGYSIVSKRNRESISLAVNTLSFLQSIEDAKAVVEFQLSKDTTKYIDPRLLYLHESVFESFFHIPVFVEVSLLSCPTGFQLVRGKCVCHQILIDNNIDTCFFSNGKALILRPAPYWIGLPNDTNSSILVHPHCPFDYCQSEDINITSEYPNAQCQYQRSGVLCGSCREGFSMILGSSECSTCSNVYLVSIGIFFLMGVALVTIVILLNMTVSVGTLNGLILFANILQANKTTFLPPTTSNTSAFLSVFIAWLNLDLGIPMCFFDGLTTYVKTWLQFVFPLYILALVGAIIIASKYSTRVTRLLGTNAVSVLATLVLLSYTKILRILITAFSFTTLTGSQGYRSVVWLADGNIKYFEPKHAILFLVALLVLLLLGVPYTVTLTAAPWIQRSRFKWVSSLYNRFKPLFDAYMGPYKDSHRYWTGMLLLARVVLIVLFSSIANTNTVAGPQLNLLLLSLSSSALLALTAAIKPYRDKLLNGLEIFFLTLLLIFSSSNIYISSIGTGIGGHVYIYIVLVGICFLVFLGICVGHVWYRVRKARTGRRSEPPEREEEDWYPLWQRARIRAEDEDEGREGVTISTAGTTNTASNGGRRESLVELIAESAETQ